MPKKEPVEHVCIGCNIKFYTHPKRKQKFCSWECRLKSIKINPTFASNHKGGKFINCILCGKEKWVYYWSLKLGQGKYCSNECYMKDPKSPNRQYGINNPMANLKNREKVRKGIISHICKYDIDRFRSGKKEKEIIDYLEKKFDIKFERHSIIGGYIVDGYNKEKNLVVEVDEKYHKYNYIKDIKRQQYLEKSYGCKFIRIRDYKHEDLQNVTI